jgi:hypothetical protein
MSEQADVVITPDIALEAHNQGLSPQEFASKNPEFAARYQPPTPVEPPAQPSAPVAQPSGQSAPSPLATPSATPSSGGTGFDYSRFNNATNADEAYAEWDKIRAKAEEHDTFLPKYNELKNKWEEVEPIVNVLPSVKSPFADPAIHQLNHFVQKTGIKDLKFAQEVLNISADRLQEDPLRAIAISQILANPALASIGLENLMRNAALKNGIDPDMDMSDWSSDNKLVIGIEAATALKNVTDKKSEFGQPDDFFVISDREAKSQAENRSRLEQEWSKATPQLLSEITKLNSEIEIEGVGKVTSEVALSQSEVQGILDQLKGTLQRINPDEQGRAQVKNILINAMRSASYEKGIEAAVRNYHDNYKADVEQKVRQAQVNGGPINLTNPGKIGDRTLSAADLELERIMKDRNS